MKQFSYRFPFQLRDEVSQMGKVNEFLSNESKKRMDFLSSSKKPYLTIDGTKAIDDAIVSLNWQLEDSKSGSVSLTTNRELTPAEVSGLPFQLIDRSENLAVTFNWSYQPENPFSPQFPVNTQRDLRFVWDENASLEMKTEAAEQDREAPSLGDALTRLEQEIPPLEIPPLL